MSIASSFMVSSIVQRATQRLVVCNLSQARTIMSSSRSFVSSSSSTTTRISTNLCNQSLSSRVATTTYNNVHNFPAVRNMSSETSSLSAPALTMFSQEEEMLRDATRKFAQEVIGPKVKEMDHKGELDRTLLKQLFEQGLMGIEVPAKYGGNEMSFTQSIIVIEELAKVDPAISVIVDIQNTLINVIFSKFASDAQKEKYLPLLSREYLGSFCLSEAACGSDAFALKTTAIREGDNYRINGSKFWISNAKEAGLFLVFATIDPSKGYKGITAFLVERDTPGLTVGKKEDKMGIRASSTCEVLFNDVVVPSSSVLGKVGQGYKIAIEALNEGRIGIGAQMVGLAQGTFDATLPYTIQRKAFGQSISKFQGMQFSFAEARTEIEAARLMVYNAARLRDSHKPFVMEAAMAKLYSSQVAEKVASVAIEWCGGVGFMREFPQEKFYRDAKIGSIYEGTSNLQKQTIAQLLLKQYE